MSFFNRTAVGLLACTLTIVGLLQPAYASINSSAEEDIQQLATIVNRVLKQNPELQSAYAAAEAASSRLKGAGLPINNPEIELGAERTDINTYTLGISQTIDWNDKQEASEKVAQAELASALAKVKALRLTKSSELLEAIGKLVTYHKITELSKSRTKVLERFSKIVGQLHAAGDISQTDLELSRLSLSEAVMQHASNGSELIDAKASFYEISGYELDGNIRFPKVLPAKLPNIKDEEKLVQSHPEVQAAYLASQAVRQQMHFAEQDRKADPTIGVYAGKEDKEGLVGLSFSMPLQVRNDFRFNVDAAVAETIQAEKEAMQSYQSHLARLNSAYERYNLIANAWSLWVSQGQHSLKQRVELLETQFKSGELSTTDYLLQVQQTLDTQIAGVELHGELWGAWVEWLSVTGRLNQWLNNTASE